MKKTTFVIILFLGALLAGVFVRYAMVPGPIKKEHFAQREIGSPLDMQAAEGSVGVAGYNGTPPLLGSEPKPVSERPYDMANDNQLFEFQNNKVSADCCPSPFSTDGGCICLTDKQLANFASRGGNRIME